MGSSSSNDYCAFTKAVEHLGDRWSLLIVRELFQFGPQGFNRLAAGLPGSISRSVLAARLRKLEEIGLVARIGEGRAAPYHLAPAGQQLIPTMKSLWDWAEHWMPEDPAMAQRDPTVILWWLTHRVDVSAVPVQQVALELPSFEQEGQHAWILLARNVEASLCLEDPLLDRSRYVYVETDSATLLAIARGRRGWAAAVADRTVRLYGEPELLRALPTWFRDVTGSGAEEPSPIAAA